MTTATHDPMTYSATDLYKQRRTEIDNRLAELDKEQAKHPNDWPLSDALSEVSEQLGQLIVWWKNLP